MSGLASIFIDCDQDPFCPPGWRLQSHQKNGVLEWDMNKIAFYLPERQIRKELLKVRQLYKELEKHITLSANVLDFFLDHRETIPEVCLEYSSILFLATIYWHANGRPCVRSLLRQSDKWQDSHVYTDDILNSDECAIILQP